MPPADTAPAAPEFVFRQARAPQGDAMFRDWILGLIIVGAFLLRAFIASTSPYLPDEHELSIPLANRISFSPATLNLPIRGVDHPALPSYFIKASAAVFGHTPVGYRMLHVLIGVFVVGVVYRLTSGWAGSTAARWAAALVAFNEYHVGVSAFATAKGPHLLFVVLAAYAFVRFLQTERPGSLYLAFAMTGFGFYCKEHSALLLPIFVAVLARRPYRRWLKSAAIISASVVFGVIVLPDMLWNAGAVPGGPQATYLDHLARIGGLGFTPNYFLFFARDAIQAAAVTLTGGGIPDSVSENPSMNSALGLVLFGAMSVFALRRNPDAVGAFLLTMFWGLLCFFVFIRPGDSPRPMDKAAWYWVDATLFPAAIVAGKLLAAASGWRRIAAWVLATGAIVYASLQWSFDLR